MQHVTLKQLSVPPSTREQIAASAASADVAGAILYAMGDDDHVLCFGPGCLHPTEELAAAALRGRELLQIWRRDDAPARVKPGSRTARALELLDNDPTMTPNAAARKAGVGASAVYRALDRVKNGACCPTCRRPL